MDNIDKQATLDRILRENPKFEQNTCVETADFMIVMYYLFKLETLGLITKGPYKLMDKALSMIPVLIDAGWRVSDRKISLCIKALTSDNGEEKIEGGEDTIAEALTLIVSRIQLIGYPAMQKQVEESKNGNVQ